jgi:hypothetical protein
LNPDEYLIYFVSSEEQIPLKSDQEESIVGWYYTHSNKLIIWPKQENERKVVNFKTRSELLTSSGTRKLS